MALVSVLRLPRRRLSDITASRTIRKPAAARLASANTPTCTLSPLRGLCAVARSLPQYPQVQVRRSVSILSDHLISAHVDHGPKTPQIIHHVIPQKALLLFLEPAGWRSGLCDRPEEVFLIRL